MPSGVCPECGAERVGALRFCLACGFDFDESRSATGAPPEAGTTAPGTPEPDQVEDELAPLRARAMAAPERPVVDRVRLARLGLAVALVGLTAVVALALGRPGARTAAPPSPSPAASSTAAAVASPTADNGSIVPVSPGPSVAPSAVASARVSVPAELHAPGESVVVQSGGAPYLSVTVDRVRIATRFDGPTFDDVPRTTGYVFILARVTYGGLAEGAVYNRFDWDVLADGIEVDEFTTITEGPKPELGSGQLVAGASAQGWLVYEVPAQGQIVLSFVGSFRSGDPLFGYVLRR